MMCPLIALTLLSLPAAPSAADPPLYSRLLTQLYTENGTWTPAALVQLLQPPHDSPDCSQLPEGAAAGQQLQQQCQQALQCKSAGQLLSAAAASSQDGAPSISALCPGLLFQRRLPGCAVTDADEVTHGRRKPKPAEVWGYGLLFVTLISLSSIFAVMLLPLLGTARFQKLMPALIGLAVGSLASSALFHLIPQAFGISSTAAGHSYLNTSLAVLAGSWIFFMLERIMKIILDYKVRRSASDGKYATDHLPPGGDTEKCSCSGSPTDGSVSTMCSLHMVTGGSVVAATESAQEAIRSSFGHVDKKPRHQHHHDHDAIQKAAGGDLSFVATVAWMIVFGDGFHNLLDGISIGAAFSENVFTGISISVAVLCEELPHELGDFAVLLEAGMTVRQAVFYNFASACTCYVGLVLGIIIGDFTESASFVFALAAGMFLYISFVDMMPEMNEAAEKASAQSVYRGLRVLLVQNIGLFVGCFALFTLAYFQDYIDFE